MPAVDHKQCDYHVHLLGCAAFLFVCLYVLDYKTTLTRLPAACPSLLPSPLPNADQEYIVPTSGQAVGATLCLTLTSLIHPDTLTIPHDPDGLPLVTHQGLEGDSLVFIVALRNLLAHSHMAKVAALKSGLHASMLHCCQVAAQVLAAAEKKAAAAGAGAGTGEEGSGWGVCELACLSWGVWARVCGLGYA